MVASGDAIHHKSRRTAGGIGSRGGAGTIVEPKGHPRGNTPARRGIRGCTGPKPRDVDGAVASLPDLPPGAVARSAMAAR